MTNHTNPEAAAGRLRRVGEFEDPAEFEEVVYAGEHYGPYEDQCTLSDAMMRETDPTLVDETFARSIALQFYEKEATYKIGEMTYLIIQDDGSWMLEHAVKLIRNPTIGDVYTACRLFKVTITAPAGTV